MYILVSFEMQRVQLEQTGGGGGNGESGGQFSMFHLWQINSRYKTASCKVRKHPVYDNMFCFNGKIKV